MKMTKTPVRSLKPFSYYFVQVILFLRTFAMHIILIQQTKLSITNNTWITSPRVTFLKSKRPFIVLVKLSTSVLQQGRISEAETSIKRLYGKERVAEVMVIWKMLLRVLQNQMLGGLIFLVAVTGKVYL